MAVAPWYILLHGVDPITAEPRAVTLDASGNLPIKGEVTTIAGLQAVTAAPGEIDARLPVGLVVEAEVISVSRDTARLVEQGYVQDPRADQIPPQAFATRGMLVTGVVAGEEPVLLSVVARSQGQSGWLMIFSTDDITTVADGTRFIESFPIPKQTDGDGWIERPVKGQAGVGLGWAFSTTADVLTLSGGGSETATVWGTYKKLEVI